MNLNRFIVFLSLLSSSVSFGIRQGLLCNPSECCNTTIDGYLTQVCPTKDFHVFGVKNYPPLIILQQSTVPRIFQESTLKIEISTEFTLRVLTMNVWGFNVWAEERKTRIAAIARFLRQSQHDIVFIQEAWYHADFQVLKDTFPHSTFYGTPGSILCPSIRNDQSFYLQLLPIDCHGLMILSKHNILSNKYVFFQDRIPETREYFGRRGALAATIEVTKAVAGVTQSIKVYAINAHLATWYGENEELWTSVRENQADEVIALVTAPKEKSDLVVVAGDLNSTPESAVLKKFFNAGMVDTLLDLEGNDEDVNESVTWGHANNTWTAGEQESRLDYVLYTHSRYKLVRTSAYHTVDTKTEKDGEEISLSDHMWVEADLRITVSEDLEQV